MLESIDARLNCRLKTGSMTGEEKDEISGVTLKNKNVIVAQERSAREKK